MAAVVVWSHSIVLFLFSSVALESWLKSHGLPQFPLVPVSSSQAIVGAVIGIGLLKGGKSIRWKTVAGITSGWVTTPIIAALISLLSLFFLQNVFQQDTFRKVEYMLDNEAMVRIEEAGIATNPLEPLLWKQIANAVTFKKEVEKVAPLDKKLLDLVMEAAEIDNLEVSTEALEEEKSQTMSKKQYEALTKLSGRIFTHRWQLAEALAEQSQEFQFKNDTEHNTRLNSLLYRLYNQFRQ
jgi:PiT family inorganic phosphate transporter